MKRKIYIIYAFLGMTFTGCDNILDSTPAVLSVKIYSGKLKMMQKKQSLEYTAL